MNANLADSIRANRERETPQARTATIFEIAELIANYAAEQCLDAPPNVGNWRVRNRNTGEYIKAVYVDEAMARAGARLAAACDIRALFDDGRR